MLFAQLPAVDDGKLKGEAEWIEKAHDIQLLKRKISVISTKKTRQEESPLQK